MVLLDDGFQHRKVHRDIDLVLVDADRGFGNGHCLPAGPLREPLEGLGRADFIGLHHRQGKSPSARTTTLIEKYTSNPSFLSIESSLGCPLCPKNSASQDSFPQMENYSEEKLREGIWLLVTGIAQPRPLIDSCRHKGIRVDTALYPDHFPYPLEECIKLFRRVTDNKLQGILTTEKDFWKLQWQAGRLAGPSFTLPQMVVLPLEMQITEGRDTFFESITGLF